MNANKEETTVKSEGVKSDFRFHKTRSQKNKAIPMAGILHLTQNHLLLC